MTPQKPKNILEQLLQTSSPGANLVGQAIRRLTSTEEIRQFLEEYAASGRGWPGPRGREERIDQLIGAYLETKQLLHSLSDSGQPYYTDKARQCWDNALCWYQRLVEFASNGLEKEGLWETMPGLVQEGILTREDVRSALERHLQNVISACEKSIQVAERVWLEPTAPAYWQERKCEAREALAALKENKPVKYRGIELSA